MSKNLSLSVVIPVYNEGELLAACLDALLAQIDDIKEIIIVDNNSSDGSLELAQRYGASCSKIVVASESVQGIVPARDHGFRLARGHIVARIDADTMVCPGWAEVTSRYFADHADVAAITGWTHYFDLPLENFTGRVSDLIHNEANLVAAGTITLYGPNMALRAATAKHLAQTSCDTDGRLNEDMDLTIHLLDEKSKIAFVPEMKVYISGRRMKYSPAKFIPYCFNWPRTYWRHGYYGAAIWTFALSVFFCFMQALICLPLRAYDHENVTFSWRRMLDIYESRIIP